MTRRNIDLHPVVLRQTDGIFSALFTPFSDSEWRGKVHFPYQAIMSCHKVISLFIIITAGASSASTALSVSQPLSQSSIRCSPTGANRCQNKGYCQTQMGTCKCTWKYAGERCTMKCK